MVREEREKEINVEDENVEILEDISMLDKYIQDTEEHFIIGGATIYKLLMPKANKIYLTLIHEKFDGDVYFPEIRGDEWKIVDRTAGITDEKNPYNYEFVTYTRI